jgi:hypothetical protein
MAREKDQTLLEAYEAHRGALEKPADMTDAPAWLVEFYEAHDAVHALLGLSTRGRHEILVDGWSLLATDLGFRNYRRAMTHAVTWRLIRSTPLSAALSMLLGMLFLPIFSVRVAWLRRRPVWPFWRWRELASEPVAALRARYRVVGHRPVTRDGEGR